MTRLAVILSQENTLAAVLNQFSGNRKEGKLASSLSMQGNQQDSGGHVDGGGKKGTEVYANLSRKENNFPQIKTCLAAEWKNNRLHMT